jgi:sulfite reductase alpha subunit-like flavoprotein
MPKMTWKRLLVSTALLTVGLSLGAFLLMTVKDQAYAPSAPYSPGQAASQEVAVIYYSRTGHSEAVAREIARVQRACRVDPHRLPADLHRPSQNGSLVLQVKAAWVCGVRWLRPGVR